MTNEEFFQILEKGITEVQIESMLGSKKNYNLTLHPRRTNGEEYETRQSLRKPWKYFSAINADTNRWEQFRWSKVVMVNKVKIRYGIEYIS
jgi:hypothetical protein